MRPLAGLLALALAGCAQGPGGMAGPPLKPVADPSAVVAADIGFNQLAQSKGQWTAFRDTAAKGAQMFVPERVLASDWLKGRANPAVPVQWQPHAVWSSCNGSHAVTRGAWERPGSAGSYVTVWERQNDGKYKWLLDMSLADERSLPAPEMLAARVADCGNSPQQRALLAANEAAIAAANAAYAAMGDKGVAFGSSGDKTLAWESHAIGGARRFSIVLWNGKAFERVFESSSPPQAR